MELENLSDLYIDELKDIYNAEHQILKALPEMIKAAHSRELARGFREHLQQTRGQVKRLKQIFKDLEMAAKGKKCNGMAGLLKEGAELMKEDAQADVMDAGLISAAQRVEHYEIAAYGTVRTYAKLLGHRTHVRLLEETLKEESDTDKKLSKLAEAINVSAA